MGAKGTADDIAAMTWDELNEALAPLGLRPPANPTPAQVRLARVMVAWSASLAAHDAAQAAKDEHLAQLAADPERKAAYDAARAAYFFDTEARFPGWLPQPLTSGQHADADLVARLQRESAPSWATTDPVRAAIRDEANRLILLSHGRSPEARAVRSEIGRLSQLGSRMGRQDSRRRRREAPGVWPRMDPWPSTCQVCDLPIDTSRVWPDPLSGSLGHEPPVFWAAQHPEYDGPRVLRPEHLACNLAKSDRPDWETR